MKQVLKRLYIKFKVRNKCIIGHSCNISLDSHFEGYNFIGDNTHFSGYLGFGSYVSAHCDLASVKIGKYTSIAPHVVVNPGRHPMSYPYVSTHPIFFSIRCQNGHSFVSHNVFNEIIYLDNMYSVSIGNDCWIGEGAFLVGGITIGNGAVVLAHAVVTKDVPPYAIVAGIPAKVIKYRYSSDDIEFLQKAQWWNKTPEWLKRKSNLFSDFEKFKENFYEK